MSDDSFCHTKGDSLEWVEGLVCNSSRGMKRNFKNLKNEIKKKLKFCYCLSSSSPISSPRKNDGERSRSISNTSRNSLEGEHTEPPSPSMAVTKGSAQGGEQMAKIDIAA